MKKRLLSIMLSAVIFLSAFAISPTVVTAAGKEHIVDWADYMYNATWTAQKTVKGWNNEYTFTKGETYHVPYGQPVNSGKYVGYGVTVEEFLSSAKDPNSIFYTKQSEYAGCTSTYYANDCSGFVSYCWNIPRNTTASIPYYGTSFGAVNESNIDKINIGDALNSTIVGHVVLVTDVTYLDNKITSIEITEQTPPQLRRAAYTRSQLLSRYSKYTIYRRNNINEVPPAPTTTYTISYNSGKFKILDLPLTAASGDNVSFMVTPDKGYYIKSVNVNSQPIQPTNGIYSFTMVTSDIDISVLAEKAIIGDVDDDGHITIIDATMIQRHLANLVTLDDRALTSADADGDFEITIIDATTIQRYIARLIGYIG